MRIVYGAEVWACRSLWGGVVSSSLRASYTCFPSYLAPPRSDKQRPAQTRSVEEHCPALIP